MASIAAALRFVMIRISNRIRLVAASHPLSVSTVVFLLRPGTAFDVADLDV